ncbi:YtxH domain-containing protein [Anoxybacillus sp. TBDG-1]
MSKNSSFLLGAIIGGIAGAAATLFLSSERGKQLLNESTELLNESTIRGKQILNNLSEIKNTKVTEERNGSNGVELKNEQEEQKPLSSIPIPLPSSDVEQLLKETEQAVHDAEKRLNKGTDAHGEN